MSGPDKHVFESSSSQPCPGSSGIPGESSSSQPCPGSSGILGESSSSSQPCPGSSGIPGDHQESLVTFVQYIKQEPSETNFSWNQQNNTVTLNQSLSSVGSASTVNSSFCSLKSELDEDSQFSHASSSKTDSWLTESELKPQSKY